MRRPCVHAEPVPGRDQLRSFARVGIATTMLTGRTHPRLIPPMDLPALLRRPPLDLRILLLQPFGHGLGILLVGLPHRLLGRESPPAQILAHGAYRRSNTDLLLDQLLDGLTGPQRRS